MNQDISIAIFKSEGRDICLEVKTDAQTVWLNRQQMAELFERDVKTIGKHIQNALREELKGEVVVANFETTTRHGAIAGKMQTHLVEHYNLDVVISVGYRVESKRGVEFRRWANRFKTSVTAAALVLKSPLKYLEGGGYIAESRLEGDCKHRRDYVDGIFAGGSDG